MAEGEPKLSLKDSDIEALAYPDLVAQYTAFKNAVHFEAGVIYHPCCAYDRSPSKAFPDSRVIYVDEDSSAVQALQKEGCDATKADVLAYNPGEVDVLILINPQVFPEKPAQFIKDGGYVVCNNYHGSANWFRSSNEYALVGVIVGEEGQAKYETEGINQYFEEVDTEEAFQGMPEYQNLTRVISEIEGEFNVTIPGETIFERRSNLIKMISDSKLGADWIETDGVFMHLKDASICSTIYPIPAKKRNTSQFLALFVFQKRNSH